MDASIRTVRPLRQRMLDDMRMRKLEQKTQDAYIRTADVYYMSRNYTQARTMYDNVIKFSWPAEDYATFQRAMIAGISPSASCGSRKSATKPCQCTPVSARHSARNGCGSASKRP